MEGLNAKLRILREKIEESKTQMKSAHEEGRKRVEALVAIAGKEVQMLRQKGTEIDKRSVVNFGKLKEVMLEEIKDARNKVKKEREANKKYLEDFKRAAVAELDKVRKEMNDVKSHSDKYLEMLKGVIAAELTNVNKKVNAKVEGFGKIVDEMITEKLRSTNHRLAELQVGTNDAIKSSAASFQLSLNELQQKWTESANKFSKQMQAKFQLQIAEATGKIAQNQETEKRMWEEIALLKKEIAHHHQQQQVV